MKLEALKRQGIRNDLTCTQVEYKLDYGKKSVEKVAEEAGESRAQIQRYVRLTELQPELQQMVDDKKIAFTPAVDISYRSCKIYCVNSQKYGTADIGDEAHEKRETESAESRADS